MSYDVALLTPEVAGPDPATALEAAADRVDPVPGEVDPRVAAAHAELVAIVEPVGDDDGWVSVWPIDPGPDSLSVPVTYPAADDALVRLLRIAARHGLVLVDLSSDQVHQPAPGEPVGVKAGDGTRLGALTEDRLRALVDDLRGEDPWLVLERDDEDYVQTYRDSADAFRFEYRDGSSDRHYATTTTSADETAGAMWRWLTGGDGWSQGLAFEKVDF